MKIIYGIGQAREKFKNVVLAIGVFDGLHRGHQALIKKAISKAKLLRGQACVMTFDPHPVHVLHPDVYLPLIVSLPHRLYLMEKMGVAAAFVVNFTKRFSRLSPQEFIKRYIVDVIKPAEIIIGDDFRFGKDRLGTLEYLRQAGRKYGFRVNAVDAVRGGKKKISSTLIRQLIAGGKLNDAEKLLGRKVSLMGKVVKGDSRGKKLGFPTANIYPTNEVIPPLGVYAVRVSLGNEIFDGMANVGRRPSFNSRNSTVNVEVHIFDFDRDLYGKEIIIEFIEKIREERVFKSFDKLVKQLKKDEMRVRKIFSK